MNEKRFISSNYPKMSVEEIRNNGKVVFTSEFLARVKTTTIMEAMEQVGQRFPEKGESNHNGMVSSLMFAQAIAKAMPIYCFQYCDLTSRKHELWVFRDDCPYTVGKIGYGDFCTTVTPTDNEFMVCSFPINNGKYDPYSEQHFMARSVHMDKSVKNALKYLRSPSPYDCALLNGFRAKRHFTDIGDNKNRHQQSLLSNLTGDENALLLEFRNMISTEYNFINKEFGDRINGWVKAYDENKEREQKKLNMYFVRVYTEDDIQMFDVIPMTNVHLDVGISINENSLVTYTSDNIPEDIMGKVSVLSMVKAKEYVDDVGYRDEAGCFYITQ